MANIDDVYRDLTGIDIEEQKLLWDERGKGYYGEYLVFKELYPNLTGYCKILMNLQIPTADGQTTEIDLLLIHETGLYVFEMKHYKGTIYGKPSEPNWTQYFRTAPNSHFYNPILQNQYHIKALQKMFPCIPSHSFVVFTSPECDLRVECNESDVTVCPLSSLYIPLQLLETQDKLFDGNRIDAIFNELTPFSPITTTTVPIGKESIPFYQYINTIIKDFQCEKERLNDSCLATKKAEQKKARVAIILSAIAVAACIALSILACHQYHVDANSQIAAAEQKLAEFKQNFLHIDEIGNKYIDALNSYVDISHVSLLPLTEDAVSFTARIATTNDTYGIALTKNSRYIVMTNSGKIIEYNVFGEHLRYSRISNMIGKGIRSYGDLAKVQFYGISNIDDISYIKITDIELFKLDSRRTIVKDKLEIELYSK